MVTIPNHGRLSLDCAGGSATRANPRFRAAQKEVGGGVGRSPYPRSN
jgi:hypothetical protein